MLTLINILFVDLHSDFLDTLYWVKLHHANVYRFMNINSNLLAIFH